MANIFVIVAASIPHLIHAPVRLFAYIDPGTGSLVLQVLVGAIVGSLVTAKIYWQRLKAFFKRGATDDESGHEPEK